MLDSVSSPITKRAYNLGRDEFFAWYSQEPRLGFTQATVAALARGPRGPRAGGRFHQRPDNGDPELAVETADNGLVAPELSNGITRVKGVASKGEPLGNWFTAEQAQTL